MCVSGTTAFAAAHDIAMPEQAWRESPNATLSSIVGGMTPATNGSRALGLGVRGDESVEQIIADYGRDCLGMGVLTET